MQPLLVKEVLETTTDGETMAQRFGVKLFLTNKRLFFLDAELDRGASCACSARARLWLTCALDVQCHR